MLTFSTAALCDAYASTKNIQIAEPIFQSYGAKPDFSGQISTLKIFENDTLLINTLEESGQNRVLVVDGGGSHHCALIDAELARCALNKGWQGLVVYGCIRDASQINQLPIGIRALHTYPLKTQKKNHGDRDILVSFAGINFRKDHFLYADADGIIVSESQLG
ncbi:MAG: ribonuclease E activity regulator RraA [Methylovulum sp.]|jgi:regulator of ribonuclease activity A|nr:ribonuclease E activity regulator RraA [Methylovulum sp.]MCF7999146.1 ribonuclease E activity regulator RraA [Methylovulum sp.]